ncbi:hypothetical protein DF044_01850 [Burkholderia contaminans]|uniref:hypothetical protein n=1 Tax=Burkholderia contaminans TaxID=488447 RepID=UPI000F5B2B8C|nr:hypothetical protein [Burkholderia contaminans]RQT19431.1 hypothetical protein DF044_01850 [Burkholderia contaminans]
MIYDGEVIEKEGYVFKVFLRDDCDNGEPWKNSDGHGPVSEWARRDKLPGERVLNTDGGSKRFYDVQGANQIAKRDGWGLSEAHLQELRERVNRWVEKLPNGRKILHAKPEELWREPTQGEIRAEAVRRDYEFLRGWCNDQWNYVGVCVMCLGKVDDDPDTDVDLDYLVSKDLWGIESNAYDYIKEVAHEHIDEFLAELADERQADAREAAEALYWAQRDTVTGVVRLQVM